MLKKESEYIETGKPYTTFTRSLFQRTFPNRDMASLFCGQVISQIGDSIYQIGLMWLVLEMTGSKSTVGIVAMAVYLPMLLLGLPGGIIADRLDRRKIMIGADFMRGLLVLIIPILLFMDRLHLWVILAVSFSISGLTAIFNPARDAIMPDLVHAKDLLKSNSLVQASATAAMLLGPAFGAAAIGILGIQHLFTIDSVTFMVSMAAILFIRARSANNHAHGSEEKTPLADLKEIFADIKESPRLRFLLILTAVNNFFIMGPAIVGTPIFVKEVLHREATAYALVESCLGLGMIAGSVLINYLAAFMKKGRILLLGMMFDGITLSLVYITDTLPALMGLMAFHAIGIPLIVVSRTSLIQEWTRSEKLGRVFSLVNVSVVGVTALTSGVTGVLADFIPVDTIFGIFGLAAMICGVVGWNYADLKNS